MARPDITGKRYGRLVALSRYDYPRLNSSWLVRCDCGAEFVERRGRLGHKRSCGCLKLDELRQRAQTHGQSRGNRLYATWAKMRSRTTNANVPMYYRYGGRGIKVCPEWDTFPPFQAWALANGYSDDLTIDRIDNDGDYTPDNCRWATPLTQSRNRSSNILNLEYRGKTACLSEHVADAGQNYARVRARVQTLGWSISDALETPSGARLGGSRERDPDSGLYVPEPKEKR